jgi:pimeloyl-ACP methyl ester carboxylesterase
VIATLPHCDLYLDHRGLRLHAVEWGPPRRSGASPLVLLHGVTGHASVWTAVVGALEEPTNAIALDFRGFGDSQWSPDHAYATGDHASDVVAWLDALEIPRADLIGSSWGALVAIAVAAAHPERVSRLGIVDVEPSFSQGETDLMPRPRLYESHDAAFAHERASNPHADAALLALVAAGGTRAAPGGTLAPKHDPFFFERWPFRSDDWWDALPRIHAPALLVHAGASFVRREVMEKMAQALPRGHLVEVPDSTHVVPIDAPLPLARHLDEFLATPRPE